VFVLGFDLADHAGLGTERIRSEEHQRLIGALEDNVVSRHNYFSKWAYRRGILKPGPRTADTKLDV